MVNMVNKNNSLDTFVDWFNSIRDAEIDKAHIDFSIENKNENYNFDYCTTLDSMSISKIDGSYKIVVDDGKMMLEYELPDSPESTYSILYDNKILDGANFIIDNNHGNVFNAELIYVGGYYG